MKIKTLKPFQISSLPHQPGVYLFYDKEKSPLYIGKSSDLKERVKNHFNQPKFKDNLFIEKIKKVGYIPLPSETGALILESQLIKKYQPKFNVLFKDDKNYFYVGITKEDWPRIFITHQPLYNKQLTTNNKQQVKSQKKQKIKKLSVVSCQLSVEYIGPFVGGTALKETLKTLRKIFPYRSCKTLPKKPCLWYDLNRCPAPCLLAKEWKEKPELKKQLEKRKKDYQKNIKNLKMVLEGRKENLISEGNKKMQQYAQNQEFERAAKIRDQIKSLKEVFSHKFLFSPSLIKKEEDVGGLFKKTLSLPKIPKRIEGYDISHFKGKEMVGSMVVFKLSQINTNLQSRIYTNNSANLRQYLPAKKEYRLFKIKTLKHQNDTACLKEVIERRFTHPEWSFPDLIYVDGGKSQLNAVAMTLKKIGHSNIPVISLAKKKNILYNFSSKESFSLDNFPQTVKMTILRLRDEAHRFAISYHKKLRAREFAQI